MNLRIKDLAISDLSNNCDLICDMFREAKSDSIVCRIPRRLVQRYFERILSSGSRIMVALNGEDPVGYLVFVKDNNVSLNFLRDNKFGIMAGLLLSGSLTDKALLVESILNGISMLGRELPQEFENEISLLAVREGFRGKGIGGTLIDAFLATHQGVVKVKTGHKNSGAIKFYKTMGFAEDGSVTAGIKKLVCFRKP
jgi:ribosomal protein S18 acetylase RimI-like enzyme